MATHPPADGSPDALDLLVCPQCGSSDQLLELLTEFGVRQLQEINVNGTVPIGEDRMNDYRQVDGVECDKCDWRHEGDDWKEHMIRVGPGASAEEIAAAVERKEASRPVPGQPEVGIDDKPDSAENGLDQANEAAVVAADEYLSAEAGGQDSDDVARKLVEAIRIQLEPAIRDDERGKLQAMVAQPLAVGEAKNQPSYYGSRPDPTGFGPLTRKLEAASEAQRYFKQGDELHDDPPETGSYQILEVTTVSTADDRREDVEREALIENTSNVLASAVADGLLDEEYATLIDHTLEPAMISALFASSDGTMPHSASQPAIVLSEEDGSPLLECWLYAGELHRENGPAIVRYWPNEKGMDELHYLANTGVTPREQKQTQSEETGELSRWSS